MAIVAAPEGAVVHDDGKVYRRKPWRSGTFALILIGNMVNEAGPDGKPTGQKSFVSLVHKESTNPLKVSRKTKVATPGEALAKAVK
jgi:hypothetical protein